MRGSSVRGQSSWQAQQPEPRNALVGVLERRAKRRLALVRKRQLKGHPWYRTRGSGCCVQRDAENPGGNWRRRSSSSSRFLCTYQRSSSSRAAISGATSRRVGASRSSNLRRVARFPS